MSKVTFLIPFLFLASFVSCLNHSPGKESKHAEDSAFASSTAEQSDPTYMLTGFYFLTDGKDGIRKKQEASDKVYSLSPTPFASVRNIVQTRLETTKLSSGDYTELCLIFDAKGTRGLEEGTGDELHPKIAAVIAGRLLYVVDNTHKIKTGVMCVGLVGYSEEEMSAMKQAVDRKN